MIVKSRRSFGLILKNGLFYKQFVFVIAQSIGGNLETNVLLTEGNELHLLHTVEALDVASRAEAFRSVERYVKKEMSADKVLDVVIRSTDGRDLCYITEDNPAGDLMSRFYRREKDRHGVEYLSQFAGRYQSNSESRRDFTAMCERRLAEHSTARARRNAGRVTADGGSEGEAGL